MILEKVKKTLRTGIERYAKEANLLETDVQFLIAIEVSEESGEVVYYLLHNYKKVKKVAFKEIMNVKIDILGQGIIVSNFIARYMMTIAEENAKDISEISVMICKQGENLRLFEYYRKDLVRELNLEEIVQT
jgi:hypothetical protein